MIHPQRLREFRCRFCGMVLNAWLPVSQAPEGVVRLGHLSPHHPTDVGTFLNPRHTTEDIAPMAAQAFEGMQAHDRRLGPSPSPQH
jgi:hypothetical protein